MKNVSSKLLKAIEQVGGKVQKTGYNSFSKYKYITESDINEAVLPALIEQGLILTTSVENVIEAASSADQKNRFATVFLLHKIIDTASGETLEFKSVGTGADTLDKAIFKAITGSCKYFMLKLFMISGDDSDPENDAKDHAPKQAQGGFSKPEAAPAAKPSGFGKPAPKAQAAAPAPAKKSGFFNKQQAQVAPPVPEVVEDFAPEEPGF